MQKRERAIAVNSVAIDRQGQIVARQWLAAISIEIYEATRMVVRDVMDLCIRDCCNGQ